VVPGVPLLRGCTGAGVTKLARTDMGRLESQVVLTVWTRPRGDYVKGINSVNGVRLEVTEPALLQRILPMQS
jgi:hypothetical protein